MKRLLICTLCLLLAVGSAVVPAAAEPLSDCRAEQVKASPNARQVWVPVLPDGYEIRSCDVREDGSIVYRLAYDGCRCFNQHLPVHMWL